jgi:hypothetical protein
MWRNTTWLAVVGLLLAVGAGAYYWWVQRPVDQASDRLAVLQDIKARQDNWKERWRVKYGEYRRLKEAGGEPPAGLLTELKLLRLEWTGLAYRKVALMDAPPRGEEDLAKYKQDWKELGNEPFSFVWGVGRAALTGDSGQAVLAWEATADESGHRCVLLADGTTKVVDKDTFRGMPRAKGR